MAELYLQAMKLVTKVRVYNIKRIYLFGLKANATGTQTYILPPGAPSTGTSVLQSDISGNILMGPYDIWWDISTLSHQ